jgi:hypothetical protein
VREVHRYFTAVGEPLGEYIYFKPNGVPHSLTGPIMYSLTHSKSFFDDGVHGCSDLKLPNPNIGYALYRSTVR